MFSRSTEYALRAVLYIAEQTEEGYYPGVEKIAGAIGSPKSFTAKILQLLSRDASIVASFKGPGGGFFLVKRAGKKKLKAILKVMGEEEKLSKCIMGINNCSKSNPCPLHKEYAPIRDSLNHMFEDITISDMVAKLKSGKGKLNLGGKSK